MVHDIRLGLIGDFISDSRSPELHRLAGRLCHLDVSYELLIPPRLGESFETIFDRCAGDGYHGLNITYPYKELVVSMVEPGDELLRRIGGFNTVLFRDDAAVGYNTDHTGFITAFRESLDTQPPGRVCLLGAGGVGKAVAFALGVLGATHLCIADHDLAKARQLAAALVTAGAIPSIEATADALYAARGADGLVNCTPVGMTGHAGSPLPSSAFEGASWAFDAVYTPVDTEFLGHAAAHGLRILSGYELFFHQGIDAFTRFTGERPDQVALRRLLSG